MDIQNVHCFGKQLIRKTEFIDILSRDYIRIYTTWMRSNTTVALPRKFPGKCSLSDNCVHSTYTRSYTDSTTWTAISSFIIFLVYFSVYHTYAVPVIAKYE